MSFWRTCCGGCCGFWNNIYFIHWEGLISLYYLLQQLFSSPVTCLFCLQLNIRHSVNANHLFLFSPRNHHFTCCIVIPIISLEWIFTFSQFSRYENSRRNSKFWSRNWVSIVGELLLTRVLIYKSASLFLYSLVTTFYKSMWYWNIDEAPPFFVDVCSKNENVLERWKTPVWNGREQLVINEKCIYVIFGPIGVANLWVCVKKMLD